MLITKIRKYKKYIPSGEYPAEAPSETVWYLLGIPIFSSVIKCDNPVS